MKMANYKTFYTVVPDWATKCAVDANGSIWVYERNPYMDIPRRSWQSASGQLMKIGAGPEPKDWMKELYDLV